MAGMKRVRMLISGRVQGVFFRYYTREEANRIGLRGWVRNLPDGRVEVLAEGTEEQLRLLESVCRKGPPHARVSDLRVTEEPVREGEFTSFDIVH